MEETGHCKQMKWYPKNRGFQVVHGCPHLSNPQVVKLMRLRRCSAGSSNFWICRFTILSKAISGTKSLSLWASHRNNTCLQIETE